MSITFGDGRWKNLGELGSGGQGTTYKVVRPDGDDPNTYALKILHSNDPQALDRFRRDAQTVSTLDNLHVIRLHEDSTSQSPPYYVTEFCSGGNLESAKDEFTGDTRRALQIFEEICRGVAVAHDKEITHRDLKPENILLRRPRGQAVVADFGICYLQDTIRLTRPTERVGPRDYMAPELEKTGMLTNIAPVNDVYSLGKILHFLLSGGLTVYREDHRETEFDLSYLHQDGRFEHINLLLDKMIVREPKRRLQTAGFVLEEFIEVRRLIEGGYNLVGSNIIQPCMYCGRGRYRVMVPRPSAGENTSSKAFFEYSALQPFAGDDWRVLTCNECGHVQWFRVENVNSPW